MNKFPTRTIEVDIKLLEPNSWNPNKQDDMMFEKEIASIKEYGMVTFPLVREIAGVYEIIDGEHRWRAAKKLGFTIMKVESLGEIDDKTAKTLTLLLNNIRGKDDVLKRAEILKQLLDGQLALFPMSRDEIAEELKLLDFDFEKFKDAEFTKEEKDPMMIALKKMLEAKIELRKVHANSRNTKLQILIEQYYKMVRTFQEILKVED